MQWCEVVWNGVDKMEQSGVVRSGVEWRGIVSCVEWCGLVWNCVERCEITRGAEWYGKV